MGLIKSDIDDVNWLSKYGFEYSNHPVAGYGNKGYERGYYHKNNLEFLRVNICFPNRKVYLYNEYECGGLLWEREIDIPDGICITDEEEFIDWLDEELDFE